MSTLIVFLLNRAIGVHALLWDEGKCGKTRECFHNNILLHQIIHT